MEEISLAALPSGYDSDNDLEESDDEDKDEDKDEDEDEDGEKDANGEIIQVKVSEVSQVVERLLAAGAVVTADEQSVDFSPFVSPRCTSLTPKLT